ncbi:MULTISPECIES: TauD/TfdA family dioxygenase [unclassified Caballeronia]|uniref:TauD/TfdA family dioxygenase n=1 Tax=unclassified Caballeronia TaxID=2646786 RepID=UPI001FD1821D|nr:MULTISPECIES: TauD/TfdA family dioxygenase [unclassified Caballeronia]
MKTYSLTETERAALSDAYIHIEPPHGNYSKALASLYRVFATLPDGLLFEIFQFGRDPSSAGVMLIDGLPIDDPLPATPVQGQVGVTLADKSEKSLLGLAQLIGIPVGYLSEKDGQVVHHVVPMRGGEYTQSNRSSKIFLNFHNDSMYDESLIFNSHNPDFLLLLCLRADKAGTARTLYADARDVASRLDANTLVILRQARFLMAAPSNYTLLIHGATNGEKVWSAPVPILSGPENFPEIFVAANGVRAIDMESEHALRTLLDACQQVGENNGVGLRPGQALLINNRKGVHARTEFEASYDGLDRWLLRANIRNNLWGIRDRATRECLVFA